MSPSSLFWITLCASSFFQCVFSWTEASQSDRPVPVGHREDGCLLPRHAQQREAGQQVASGSRGSSLAEVVGPKACLSLKILCFQCLCIAPTYELALQIGQVVEQMGKFCSDVKLVYAVRGNRSAYGSLSF